MLRLLAEVVRKRKKECTFRNKNFECETLSLTVRIKEPARKAYRIPKGIRGKLFKLERRFIRDWSINKGDFIVLNPEETRRCIRKLGKNITERRYKDFTIEDIDGDGYGEIIINNRFFKAVIAPHYGARLLQFINHGTKNNEFYGGNYIKNKGYIELGGIEETVSKQGKPDELWNGLFKKTSCKEKNKVSFSYKMKKEKGVTVEKRFLVYRQFPGLLETVHLAFKPEKRKTKKKRKGGDKKKIKLTQRIFFAMGGIPDYNNLIYIPTKKELNCLRFNKPLFKRGWEDDEWWEWTHLHYAPDPGLIILERENSEDILLLFFNQEKIDYIWTGDKKRTPRLNICYREEKIKPKKGNDYETLIATANTFFFSKKEILFASRGHTTEGHFPLSFVYYSKRSRKNQSISIQRDRKIEIKKMEKINVGGIPGSFFCSTTIEKEGTKNVVGILKGKDMKVRLRLE